MSRRSKNDVYLRNREHFAAGRDWHRDPIEDIDQPPDPCLTLAAARQRLAAATTADERREAAREVWELIHATNEARLPVYPVLPVGHGWTIYQRLYAKPFIHYY